MRLGSHPERDDVAFDLDSVLSSVVSLRAAVPEDAFTAPILGTEREGQGVVIDNSGRVLTIGYLVTEAEEIWLIGNNGMALPAHVVAYDQETGFGLVQALGNLGLPAADIGESFSVGVGDQVIVGISSRRRDIHHPGPPQMERRRRVQPGRTTHRHRLALHPTGDTRRRPDRRQYDCADRYPETDL
jgi:hypothetical protein